MNTDRSLRFWQIPVVLLLLFVLTPLLLIVLVWWLLTSLALYLLVWLFWCTRGKDILFVYSDSPIWHDYIEQHIIPQIQTRSIILNWSLRRHWLRRLSLPSLVFRHFGGSREYNPMAVYFPPLRLHRSFRFWNAFRDWKHGNAASLQRVEEDFFRCIGQTRLPMEIE